MTVIDLNMSHLKYAIVGPQSKTVIHVQTYLDANHKISIKYSHNFAQCMIEKVILAEVDFLIITLYPLTPVKCLIIQSLRMP